MAIELLQWHELATDIALPANVRTKVFDFRVDLVTTPKALRIGVQGAAYLNWINASPGLMLKVELGTRAMIINPATIVTPTPGSEMPGMNATGVVRFTNVEADTVIMQGMVATRTTGTTNTSYIVSTTTPESGGMADVPMRCSMTGSEGNCAEGTPFYLQGLAYQGTALEPGFTGGTGIVPAPSQMVIRNGGAFFQVDSAEGNPNFHIEMFMTNIAAQGGAPGMGLAQPETPWMLCGRSGAAALGLNRWAWRITVEDLDWSGIPPGDLVVDPH